MQAAAAAALKQARSAAVEGNVNLIEYRKVDEGDQGHVSKKDLEHLLYLLEGKGEDLAWQNMMERSTSYMAYQAWRHDPETGPVSYRSTAVFEDATPEVVRDFFWYDEFWPEWDPILS